MLQQLQIVATFPGIFSCCFFFQYFEGLLRRPTRTIHLDIGLLVHGTSPKTSMKSFLASQLPGFFSDPLC